MWSWRQHWQKQYKSAEPISAAVLPGARYGWKQGLCWAFSFSREKVTVNGKPSSPDWTAPNLFHSACENCLLQASSVSPACDLLLDAHRASLFQHGALFILELCNNTSNPSTVPTIIPPNALVSSSIVNPLDRVAFPAPEKSHLLDSWYSKKPQDTRAQGEESTTSMLHCLNICENLWPPLWYGFLQGRTTSRRKGFWQERAAVNCLSLKESLSLSTPGPDLWLL